MSSGRFVAVTFLLLACIACDYIDTKLRVINLSDYDVSVFANFHYPDTSFAKATLNRYVAARDTGSVIVVNQKWEEAFKGLKALTLFFVPNDSVEQYGNGEDARTKLIPQKKITLTQSQLDSMKWTITFP